jgi:hypothetical protein
MHDELQLPLIKRFMLRVAPQIVRYELAGINDPTDFTGLHDRIAEHTLGVAMHLAASYARCYDSLHSEANTSAADQQKTSGSG